MLDQRDAEQVRDVEALGLAARAEETLMRDVAISEALVRSCLALAEEIRGGLRAQVRRSEAQAERTGVRAERSGSSSSEVDR